MKNNFTKRYKHFVLYRENEQLYLECLESGVKLKVYCDNIDDAEEQIREYYLGNKCLLEVKR